jgi:glycosyltransferase involved in cell wall biosynthesis
MEASTRQAEPVPAPVESDPSSSPPRRIAFVVTRGDAVGGAQVHVYEIARALRAAGHSVGVFVGPGPFVDRLRDANIPVWIIPELRREVSLAMDVRAYRHLRRALAAFNPDLVSCHASKGGWFGRTAARRLGVPSVYTAHGWLLTPGVLRPWQWVVWAAERASARISGPMIAVSEFDRQLPARLGIAPPERIRVVHNSLPDLPHLRASPVRAPPRIVTTSRLQWPKDPHTLVRALQRLAPLEWTMEIIGDGPDRAELERRIAAAGLTHRVELVGTRDDVPERLAAAQIFVLSSDREGFPISILEAMRAGLPVVASAVGGIGEAVLDGVNGALVEPRSPDAFAAALEPLVRDAALRRQQGRASRERFVDEFGFDRHVRRTWAVYEEAIASRRSPRR